MSRHVVWSAAALDELLAIGRYIATDNPNAAAMVSIRLRDTAHRLGEMATGRPGRVTGTYEKIAPGLPYILAYEIVGLTEGHEQIAILHVIHGARNWREGRWPKAD